MQGLGLHQEHIGISRDDPVGHRVIALRRPGGIGVEFRIEIIRVRRDDAGCAFVLVRDAEVLSDRIGRDIAIDKCRRRIE